MELWHNRQDAFFVYTVNGKKYLQEATHELRQVQWPTKKHAIRISIITGIFVLSSALLLMLIDFALNKGMALLRSSSSYSVSSDSSVSPGDIDMGGVHINTENAVSNVINIAPSTENAGGTTLEVTSETLSPETNEQ